jgi:hypothetical protein
MQILLDSKDMDQAFDGGRKMIEDHADPVPHMTPVQWRDMFQVMSQMGIHGEIRKFDEEGDADFIRVSMVAAWQPEETMQRAVSERDNPTTFLA